MNLSFGERPVWAPVSTTSAPPSASTASRALECMRVQRRRGRIAADLSRRMESVRGEIDDPTALSHRRHRSLSYWRPRSTCRNSRSLRSPTDSVLLRAWRDDDVDALVRRINDPDVARFLDMVPQPYRIDDARAFLAQCEESLAHGLHARPSRCSSTGSDEPVGGLGLRWDRARRGRGRGRLLGRRGLAPTRRRNGRGARRGEVGVRGGAGTREARSFARRSTTRRPTASRRRRASRAKASCARNGSTPASAGASTS